MAKDTHSYKGYGPTPFFEIAVNGGADRVAEIATADEHDINAVSRRGYSTLQRAISYGHDDVIEAFLDNGADIHQQTKYGTALDYAFEARASEETVKRLVKRGAKVSKADIAVVIENGFEHLIPLLVESGALEIPHDKAVLNRITNPEVADFLAKHDPSLVNERNVSGTTPLMCAARSDNIDVAEALVRHGAKLNEVDRDGDTALMIAARSDNRDVAVFLVGAGADVNVSNQRGDTALQEAMQTNDTGLATLLLKEGASSDIELKTVRRNRAGAGRGGLPQRVTQTPLHWAVENGCADMIPLIVAGGVDLDAKNSDGCSALQVAVDCSNIDAVNHLLEAGASLDNVVFPTYPLYWAADFDSRVLVQNMVERFKEKLEYVQRGGCTPFQAAVLSNNFEAAEEFVNCGANIERHCGDSASILHKAAKDDNVKAIEFLVERLDMTPNMKGHTGLTPVHSAASSGASKAVTCLITHGGAVNDYVDWDAVQGHLKAAALCAGMSHSTRWVQSTLSDMQKEYSKQYHRGTLASLVDSVANTRGRFDPRTRTYSPMDWTTPSGEGYADTAQILIDNGADPCEVVPFDEHSMYVGNSLLFLSVRAGHLSLAKVLLNNGAVVDVEKPGSNGQAPLGVAVDRGDIPMAAFLLDNGADVNRPGVRPPLEVAVRARNHFMVALLNENGADKSHSTRTLHPMSMLELAAICGSASTVKQLLADGHFDPALVKKVGDSNFPGREAAEDASRNRARGTLRDLRYQRYVEGSDRVAVDDTTGAYGAAAGAQR
jgi:ankyrin repeat protein